MILPIPPLSQRDSRWANIRLGTVDSTTIGSHGCVVTSMSMLCGYYNHPVSPEQLDELLTDRKLYYDGNLFVNGSITNLFPDVKFDKVLFCEATPAPISDIKSYLDAGKPVVVALINQGVRHYILVVGYDGNEIFANDPWMGDQIAINDRWGDPASKILQVNFFSGPVPKRITEQPKEPVVSIPVPVVKPVDVGGDEKGIVVEDRPATTVTDNIVAPIAIPMPTDTSIMITPDPVTKLIEDTVNNIANGDRQMVTRNRQQVTSFIDSLKSRKLILSVASAAFAFLNSELNLGLTTVQVWMVIIPLMAFVITEGLADTIERLKK